MSRHYPYISGKPFTSEKALQAACVRYMQLHGWFVIVHKEHVQTHAGIADTQALKDGRVVWIEYKGPRATVRPAQQLFRDDVEAHGGMYWLIYRPDELVDKLNKLGV